MSDAARSAAAALASALALTLSFPPGDHGWLAWLALVPVIVVCRRAGPAHAFAIGAATGAAMACGIARWLMEVPAFGAAQAIALGGYVCLYTALWCAALPVLARSRVPLVISAPAAWLVLDFARAHAGFLALPWATLAQSQHDDLAILQLASFTGEAGVTALVVAANVAVAGVIAQGRAASRAALATAFAIATVHAAGALRLDAPTTGTPLTVAAVQPLIAVGERATREGRDAIFMRLAHLTTEAAATGAGIVVWPETAVGDPRHDATLAADLAALAQSAGASLVVGAAETEKFMSGDGGRVDVRERERYNSAYVVSPDGTLSAPYRKRRLVPFGEYLPLENVAPWPRWLVPPIESGIAGDADPAPLRAGDIAVGVLICWENLFAELARDTTQSGAQVLVQLTNDAWFGRTAASAQHNLASVLRAVENGVPIAIASNTGPSQIIDGSGRVVAGVVSPFAAGIVVARVFLRSHATFYTRAGDWLLFPALALVALAFAPWPLHRRRLVRSSSTTVLT